MTIEEIQDAFRFDMDMILFDPFSGESESEEWFLERNKRNHNDMNVICYIAKKEAIDLLEELKAYKELDLEIPQHFTKEQSDWIKKYCIEKNKEFYSKAVDDVLEKLNKHYDNVAKEQKYPQYDHYCNGVDDCIDIVEQLKVGGANDD